MTRVLLVGYSGHKNFGDDLLLAQAYNELKKLSQVSIWTDVIGSDSSYLKVWFPDATIIRSKKLGIEIFRNFDRVLYFGGGVFFDYKHQYPQLLFLKKLLSILKNYHLSKLYRIRFAGIGIGLGPFQSKKALFLTKFLLQSFDFIGIRDDVSNNYLIQAGLKEKAVLGYDLSFFQNDKYCAEPPSNVKQILICPRSFPHDSEKDNYHKLLIEWAKTKESQGIKVLIYGFQPGNDKEVLLNYQMGGLDTRCWNPEKEKIEDVFKLFQDQDLIISARMHGVYVAGLVNRPFIGIDVHPKVRDATTLFEYGHCLPAKFNTEELERAIIEIAPKINDRKKQRHFKDYVDFQYRMVKEWVS